MKNDKRYLLHENLTSDHMVQMIPAPVNLFVKFEVTTEKNEHDGYVYDPIISIGLQNNGEQTVQFIDGSGEIMELNDGSLNHEGIYRYDPVNDKMLPASHGWDGNGKKWT